MDNIALITSWILALDTGYVHTWHEQPLKVHVLTHEVPAHEAMIMNRCFLKASPEFVTY